MQVLGPAHCQIQLICLVKMVPTVRLLGGSQQKKCLCLMWIAPSCAKYTLNSEKKGVGRAGCCYCFRWDLFQMFWMIKIKVMFLVILITMYNWWSFPRDDIEIPVVCPLLRQHRFYTSDKNKNESSYCLGIK